MKQQADDLITDNSPTVYDFIITGGGMAGATAAIGFAQLGLSVALVEAVQPELSISPSFDHRAVALSASSVTIFESLGIWPFLANIGCPIKHISVSDQGNFGFSRLNADDYGVDALGQVIPLDLTGPVLWQMIADEPNIKVFCPAKVTSINTSSNLCEVTIQPQTSADTAKPTKTTLTGKLLVAADGTYSKVAQLSGINYSRDSYQQHAIITNITTEFPHKNRAYERFTSSGPLALLPLSDLNLNNTEIQGNRMSLVWCFKDEEIDSALAMSDEYFIKELQQAFGYRLGRVLKVGKRHSYPLSLHIAESGFAQRTLLLGNAVHTVHPIAGQGFNLGLRDIACFIEQVESAIATKTDFGSIEFLNQFIEFRQKDWQQTIFSTDGLVRLFSHQFFPLVICRNKAMNTINQLSFLKKQIALTAMGFTTRSSRLARGFKLSRVADE